MNTVQLGRKLMSGIVALTFFAAGAASGQEATNPTADVKPTLTTNQSETAANALNTFVGQATLYDAAFTNLNFIAFANGNQLGAEVAALTPVLRSQLSLGEELGVFVTGITPDSPAAKAGLLQNDVVLNIAEDAVSNPEKFNELISNAQGKSLAVKIIRQAKPLTLNVTVPSFARYELAVQPTQDYLFVSQRFRVGVSLAEADDTLRTQLRLATGEGLVVTEVIADSPATKAGILPHDVLIKLDGKRLTTVQAATDHIQEIKDRQVTLAAIRAGQELTLQITPQASSEQRLSTTGALLLENAEAPLQIWYTPQVMMAGRMLNARAVNVQFENTVSTTPVNALEQVAELRKQLESMNKSLQSLEASLKPKPAEAKEEKTESKP